ncbi:MAG: hypothetical protein A2068_11900 [Ignavibacteria bacterium GWB2_35_6b]|nr:MAG: hypothetical protein A2068_11900 [Ignavibacteria bacterium GWB2_35_6b]
MSRHITDLRLLKYIHKEYYNSFTNFSDENKTRSAKIYVPIDCNKIAKKFKIDEDIIFGRLYYHLEKKYGYKADDNTHVPFFTLRVGKDSHCINYPLLDSVLSSLVDANKKFQLATAISIVSFIVALVSLLFSF